MVYNKQTWVNGSTATPLSDTRLNFLESGVEAAHITADGAAPAAHNHAAAEISTGQFSLARMPAGSTITLDKSKSMYGSTAGSWPTSRPTTRTDIVIIWKGDTDPGALALAGDEWKVV